MSPDYSGKSILIVGGGLLQVPAVEIAHSMGLYVVVTDRDPNCACATLADVFVQLDTRDVDEHIELAEYWRFEVKENYLAGVFTCGASVEYTVARVARAVGLPGLPPDVAHRIAHKAEMRKAIAPLMPLKMGTYADYPSALEGTSGSPAFVVKALDSSGSRGLTKVYDHADFTEAIFKRAQQVSRDGNVLIEKMLEPIGGRQLAVGSKEIAEQSVETVWQGGRGYWLNWVDRPFLKEFKHGDHWLNDAARNYAIEIGHINPARHSDETQRAVEQMCMEAGRLLGMTTGILKFDVLLTDDGPRILETTARLSGGFDSAYTSPLAHGVDYIRGAMRMALGEPIPWEDFLPRHYRHSVAWSMFPAPGRITSINGIDEAKRVPGVEHVFARVKAGDVIPPYTDCVARPLFVITSCETRKEALEAVEKATQVIKFETE